MTELMCFSYACSSQNPLIVEKLKHSNKILLPESFLYNITKDSHNSLENKLYFRVSNKGTRYGEVCGVHEFSAPPGVAHLPYHVMEGCSINEGYTVLVELVTPVKGDFIKLRLHNSSGFSKLKDPKAVLEKYMSRDYPVVTKGQTISLHHEETGEVFLMDIVETRPADIIEILNSDVNVDFDIALDCEETKEEMKEEMKNRKGDTHNYKASYDLLRFPGKGHTLGSR